MRPMTFVQGRINAQFLIEGFVASIMTAIGAFGWITVNYANQGNNDFPAFCTEKLIENLKIKSSLVP